MGTENPGQSMSWTVIRRHKGDAPSSLSGIFFVLFVCHLKINLVDHLRD